MPHHRGRDLARPLIREILREIDLAPEDFAAADGRPIVTTEKDLVKLERLPGLEGVDALAVALEVDDAEALLDLLER